MKKVCTLVLVCVALYAQEEIAMSKCSREPKEKEVHDPDSDHQNQDDPYGAPDDGPEDKEATQAPRQPRMAPPAYRLPTVQEQEMPKERPGAAKNAMRKEESLKR